MASPAPVALLLFEAVLCLGLAFAYASLYLQRRNPPSSYLAFGFLFGALYYGAIALPDRFGDAAFLAYWTGAILYFGGFSLFSAALIERSMFRNTLAVVVLIVAGLSVALIGFLEDLPATLLRFLLVGNSLLLLVFPVAVLGYYGLRLQPGMRRKPVLLAISVALLAATLLGHTLASPQTPPPPLTSAGLGYLTATALIYASISFTTPKTTMLDLSRRHHIERMLMDYFTNPQSSSSSTPAASSALSPGTLHLVKEHHLEKSLPRFLSLLEADTPGLMLSRSHPRKLRADEPLLRSIPVLWITDSRRGGKDMTLTPQPEQVYAVIETFLEKTPNGVVLVDGLEYLINYNNFDLVLHLVEQLRDLVSFSEAAILLSLHPGTLKRLELNLIERETVLLDA